MCSPCFCCDAMLGGLAKWLRFAGFDAILPEGAGARELAAMARGEGRWLLTRDRELAAGAGPRVLCIQTLTVPEQIAEVCRRLGLRADPGRFLTRCSRCNGRLAPLDPEPARSLVPPYVGTHCSEFVRCGGCGRVYWPGSHHGRIRARLEASFPTRSVDRGEDDGEA